MNRKDFIKTTGLAAGAFVVPGASLFAQAKKYATKVRVGLIGVGLRGQSHLDLLLRRNDVEVVAICDIDDRMLTRSKEMIQKSGKKMPLVYTGDPYAWKKMLDKKGLDTVVISTPWEWHKEMIIGSLEAGLKYVGTEVMLGITLQDHWDVVKAAEQYNAHVMMLENVC
ncbi:MAG TPA: Gfo/Idh/MocA family oxidoreductase, partial [Flavisolibacter sp.]